MVTRAIVLGPEFDSFQDDTEEMLVGSSFHQDAIVGIFDSLRVVRDRRQLPWFVGNQLKLLIPRDSGMPAAQPSPDIVVHLTLGPTGRYSIDVHVDGPPAFAAEVLSPSTARDRDLNDRTPPGKNSSQNRSAPGVSGRRVATSPGSPTPMASGGACP
jgi:Uma2 family endonuclease